MGVFLSILDAFGGRRDRKACPKARDSNVGMITHILRLLRRQRAICGIDAHTSLDELEGFHGSIDLVAEAQRRL